MAVETTALGFKKPDGNEPVRGGDNIISANAQTAEEATRKTADGSVKTWLMGLEL